MNDRDILRRCYFRPYVKGQGPTFSLTMWATPRHDSRGQTIIGYRLSEWDKRHAPKPTVLFEGEDFAGSPMNADDSDATVANLMGFLTVRPGDTDREYFDGYTADQLDFAETDAEALAWTVEQRYGQEPWKRGGR